MPSDKDSLQEILDEIRSMKDSQKEDKFLSKLDMMFAVLISLTIFMSGIIINNSLNQTDVNTPLLFFGISILVVFTVALIGQFIAILRDSLTQRFDFWAVLISGFAGVSARVVITYFIVFYNPMTSDIISSLGYIITTFLVPFCLLKLHQRYVAKFRIRRKEIKKRSFWFFFLLSMLIASLIRIPDLFLIPSIHVRELFPLFFIGLLLVFFASILYLLGFPQDFLRKKASLASETVKKA